MKKYKRMIVALTLAFVLNLGLARLLLAHEPPLFVVITASWCSTCQKVKPIMEELEYEYYGRVKFIILDATSKYSLEEAKRVAEENNIVSFFNGYRNNLPAIGILCPGGTKVDKVFVGESRKDIYKEALDVLLFNAPKICSL